MLSRGDPATLFKRKSCSKHLWRKFLWVPLPRPEVLCLFVQLVFLIIRMKLTNFIWTELSGHFSLGNKSYYITIQLFIYQKTVRCSCKIWRATRKWMPNLESTPKSYLKSYVTFSFNTKSVFCWPVLSARQ